MLDIFAHVPTNDTLTNNHAWGDMMGWGHSGDYAWMSLFMVVIGLVTIGIIAYLIRGAKGSASTPLDEAKMRYAKGEISEKEFEKIKKELRSK